MLSICLTWKLNIFMLLCKFRCNNKLIKQIKIKTNFIQLILLSCFTFSQNLQFLQLWWLSWWEVPGSILEKMDTILGRIENPKRYQLMKAKVWSHFISSWNQGKLWRSWTVITWILIRSHIHISCGRGGMVGSTFKD